MTTTGSKLDSTPAAATGDYGIAPPGYRLPAATRLGRVRLQVADLARSLAYYEQVLGLRVLERSAGAATLGAHGDSAPLIELRERPGAAPVPRRGRLGLYHFAILLPDRAAFGRLLAHLGRIGAHAGTSDHFVSEAIYLTDPDGLGIEVYADRPRGAWRRQGSELYMTTVPLDVQSAVAAGGGEPWTGMPAGTSIGHVHLFVSDLDAGAAFYHAGLGLDKVVWSYPGALFLSAGGYHHHLGTNSWATHAPRAEEGDARLLEWTVVVPRGEDAEGAARSIQGAGFEVARSGDGWVATDPWGTPVRVTASDEGR